MTTTQNDTLTIEKMNELIALIQPEINLPEIDKMIGAGAKIENMLLIMPPQDSITTDTVRTKHGWLKIKYSKYIEQDKVYILDTTKSLF